MAATNVTTATHITTLPSSIIETILSLVPIKEAARTSILSKDWRYKWTKIPKLVFSEFLFEESSNDEDQLPVSKQTIASERKKMSKRCKIFYAIYQVLLMRQGPILEFTLRMEVDKTCVEIDHIISYLSKNKIVKKLKLDLFEGESGAYYWIPLSVFSLHYLTDLHLQFCDLNIPPTFNGFSSLTSLCLKNNYISTKTLLHLLSNSPLLKIFTLIIHEDDLVGDDNLTIIELFQCLPSIEHLSTYSWITSCFVVDTRPHELPTPLIHLKYFTMEFTCLSFAVEIRFLACLIRNSPNLKKITLDVDSEYAADGVVSVIREAFSNIRLEHLNELEIHGFNGFKAELEFVKLILAKSPMLKKVRLGLSFEDALDKNKKSEILGILLRSPPASPVVEIIVRTMY